jgi:signal transduction histidine kinase
MPKLLLSYSDLSLRLILTLTFGGMLLMLVVVFGVTIHVITSGQIKQHVGTALMHLAAEMADKLDRSLFERYREISLIASTHEALRNPVTSLQAQRTLLESIQQTYPHYAWIGITDAKGTVRIGTDHLLEGENVAERPWFQAGLQGPYVGDVHEAVLLATLLPNSNSNADEPNRFVDIATPIFDPNGQLLGVLGAHISWAWAYEIEQSLLPSAQNEQELDIFVLAQNGDVLLGPDGWDKPFLNVTSVQNARKQPRGTGVETWPDNKEYVVGYVHSSGHREYTGLNWLILVRQPTQRAYALINEIQVRIMTVGIASSLLFAWFAWLLSGYVTRPLVTLAQAADQIRHGSSTATIPLLQDSAEVTTLAYSLHQLTDDLMTATTAERNRIARDLHDSVTQTLFSASMLADVIPQVWEIDQVEGYQKLQELRQSVRGALAEMRTLLFELRPAALIDAEIERLIRQLAEATTGRTGVQVHWRVQDTCDLPPNLTVVFYRTVQEALNNVVKHAQATQVDILLHCEARRISLTIRDNGIGFDPTTVSSDHLGLRIMRERIEAVSGQLHISSIQGQGTEIEVSWFGAEGKVQPESTGSEIREEDAKENAN